jgi:hypothetical protein
VNYRVEHAFEDDTLRVLLSGSVDEASVGRLSDDVAALSRHRPVKRLLVDVRALVDEVDAFAVLRLVERYPPEGRMQRVAVLEDKAQAKAHGLHETIARNRGYQLMHFTDPAQAESWLRQ